MSWENMSTLKNISKPQNQLSSISSGLEAYPTYQMSQTLPFPQNYRTPAPQSFVGQNFSMFPQTTTTQPLAAINAEPTFSSSVYVEDWLIPDKNQQDGNMILAEAHQKLPLQNTSSVLTETQTSFSHQTESYCTNEKSIEDLISNYQNNCIPTEQAVQEFIGDSLGTANRKSQTTSIQYLPYNTNGTNIINHDWSESVTTRLSYGTSSSFDINRKQKNDLDYQHMQPPPGPHEIAFAQTLPPCFDRIKPRQSRNKIEKQRRDKLNESIAELSYLVPQVANSNRKLDKTSILRLSAHYLRSYNYVFRDVKPSPHSGFTASSTKAALGLLGGFLLTTTYKGLVVLVSYNISEYLGYNEVDLLGNNILNIIHKDDTQIMLENLKPKPEMLGSNGELIISEEPGAEEKVAEELSQDKRKFVVRFKKLSQRSHPGQYVSCYVEGSFRKSDKARGFMQPVRRMRARTTNPCSSGNDIVFIGVVRPIANNIRAEKEVESFHTEYITYHSIDGEITECDKRISLATGYMTQEVMGINAMNFIHRDDVEWVVIALQQMYDKHSLFSESFYRLMIKNGQFIYMRTRGYLRVDDSSGVVNTLICNNTIVEEDEGERMLKVMREKYSASHIQNVEHHDEAMDSPKSPVAVVDPKDLLNAVFRMIHSLPMSPNDSTGDNISIAPTSSSPRLTYKAPKKERIVSAIQKMYTFIKTFQQDIQQAQNTLNNHRSLSFMTENRSLPELNYFDDNFNRPASTISSINLKDNIDSKYTFVFGKESNNRNDVINQNYRMKSKTASQNEYDEEAYNLLDKDKQVLCYDPVYNMQQASMSTYYNSNDLEILKNICKIGVKRSNEYPDKVISKKKVINTDRLEPHQYDLSAQNKPLDSYFSDEDLQKHIDQTIDALGQDANTSVGAVIDFDEFLKEFEN